MDLDKALEKYQVIVDYDGVFPIGCDYAVVDDEGIIAYFHSESDACAFRLMKINFLLNNK